MFWFIHHQNNKHMKLLPVDFAYRFSAFICGKKFKHKKKEKHDEKNFISNNDLDLLNFNKFISRFGK